MKSPAFLILLGFATGLSSARAEFKLTHPTPAELAKNFATPPREYSSQVTYGWTGVITREVLARDFDKLQALNLHQAWIEPGRKALPGASMAKGKTRLPLRLEPWEAKLVVLRND